MIDPGITTDDVLEGLRSWHGKETGNNWPLSHMRLGLQISGEEDRYSSMAGGHFAARNRTILNHGLQILKGQAPESEELLRERFEDRCDVLDVANRLNVSESSIYYRQRQAISQLTEILNHLEEKASVSWREEMLSRLEFPTYAKLVGIEEQTQQLITALTDENDHFIISIDGLGGMGKTALADHIVRTLINMMHFEEIAWTTAKHTHLSTLGRLKVETSRPALTYHILLEKLAEQLIIPNVSSATQLQKQQFVINHLKERSCLVVIDNLETVADYRSLLPALRKNQNPSKFLLTTRFRLLEEPDVFSLSLKELSKESSFELLRLEAQRTGFVSLADASDAELETIYDVVGGHPLALKLIVGQLRFRSLPRVLARFEEEGQKSQDKLFEYIYQEIWDTLDEENKTTLLSLTQASEKGFTFEHIVSISGLSETSIDRCLEDLILLSLVELGGNLYERRYRIHRLTEMFLHNAFSI